VLAWFVLSISVQPTFAETPARMRVDAPAVAPAELGFRECDDPPPFLPLPNAALYFRDNCDVVIDHQVDLTTEFRLEDGTYIGGDAFSYVDASAACSVWDAITTFAAGYVGGALGAWAGSIFASWFGSQVPIGASYTSYAVGIGIIEAAPLAGALLVGGLLIG
jgi:hypothetical protein